MAIPTEGLGEKRYRAGQAKQKQAAADVAATAVRLGDALKPVTVNTYVDAKVKDVNTQVDVDPDFEAEFAKLEAEEAAKAAKPIELEDPFNAAPTHARTTVLNGQKVIDMGSIKITATPEKIEVQRATTYPPFDVEEGRLRVLSQKTLDEMAAGREAVARHQSARRLHADTAPAPAPTGVANDRPVSRSREEVWLAAGLTPAEIATLRGISSGQA
jgi:hypothetical protein